MTLASMSFDDFAAKYSHYQIAEMVDGFISIDGALQPMEWMRHTEPHTVEIVADGLMGWGGHTVFARALMEDGQRLASFVATPRE